MSGVRIAYCTNVRLPSERAHGHQIAQVCDALVHLGHSVEIFAPFRKNEVQEDYWSYYGADRSVSLTHLGSYDFIASPFTPGVLGLFCMNRFLRTAFRKEVHSFDLLYTRSPALLSSLLASGAPTILELHQLPRRGRSQFVKQCYRCAIVSCLTSPMREALIKWGVDEEKIIVAGDAVDMARFQNLSSREEAQKKFNVQTDRKVIGYVGRLKTLGQEKGVGILLQALASLKNDGRFFGLIVGGPEEDQKEYEKRSQQLGLTGEDVLFTGEVPAAEVPMALAACDVFVMPFPDLPHYRFHMSPLKMFEYMASERPIITSDLPTIRDVLSEDTAVFCEPGDVQSLVDALHFVVDHREEAQRRAESARRLVEEHTWEKRMKRILSSISS